MARLLDDLLDVSRITSGRFELRKERVRIDDAVSAAIEALEPILREHELTLTTSLPDTPLWVDGDGAACSRWSQPALQCGALLAVAVARRAHAAKGTGVRGALGARLGRGHRAGIFTRIFDLFAQSDHLRGRTAGSASGSPWCAASSSSTKAAWKRRAPARVSAANSSFACAVRRHTPSAASRRRKARPRRVGSCWSKISRTPAR